jgi:hypothetical protein
MPGAFSAVIQCFFHDAIISFAMNYSAAIQHWSAYAYSLAMPATFSAAMERSVRFHLLCLLPSRRHAISCAMPVALSAALELLMRLSFAALSAKILCGFAGPCFLGPASRGHSCRLFSACRAVLGSQSVRPFLAFLIRVLVGSALSQLRCSASVGISA